MKKFWLILTVTLTAIILITAVFCYSYIHRNDKKFWINEKSGVVHNSSCMHFKNKKETQLVVKIPDDATKYRDCKICGGRIKKK